MKFWTNIGNLNRNSIKNDHAMKFNEWIFHDFYKSKSFKIFTEVIQQVVRLSIFTGQKNFGKYLAARISKSQSCKDLWESGEIHPYFIQTYKFCGRISKALTPIMDLKPPKYRWPKCYARDIFDDRFQKVNSFGVISSSKRGRGDANLVTGK